MKLKIIATALLGGMVAIAAFAPAALAAENGSANGAATDRVVRNHPGGGARGALFQDIADLLSTTIEELKARLQGGESLAQVADETGQGEAVRDLITERATERINEAAANGRITDERAAEMLEGLGDKIEERMNSTEFGARKHHRGPGRGCHGDHEGAPDGEASVSPDA